MNALYERGNYPLTYLGLTVEKMFAMGNYRECKKIERASFSLLGQRGKKVSAKLVGFDRDAESKEILSYFDDLGVQAGTVDELALFGIKYPKPQLKFPIAAFGSIIDMEDTHGNLHVAYLGGDQAGRDCDLRHLKQIWYKHYRFLVIPKKRE